MDGKRYDKRERETVQAFVIELFAKWKERTGGRTQVEFATACHIPEGTMSTYLNGKSIPEAPNLIRMIQAAGWGPAATPMEQMMPELEGLVERLRRAIDEPDAA